MYIGFIVGAILFVIAIFVVIILMNSSKKNQMLIDADNALKDKEYEKALSLSKKVLAIDNYNPWAKYYAGEACLNMGQGIKAINYFKTGLYNIQSQDQDLREVLHRKIADYYYKNESYEEAMTYYQLILKEKPNNPHSLLRIAHIHYYLKEYNKSVKYVSDYLKIAKENIDSLFLKARVYFKLQKFEQSKKNFQVLLNQPHTSDAVKMESYLRIIDIYLKDKNGEQALHYAEHANDLVHRESMKNFKPELLKRWIQAYLLQNQPGEALNILDKYQNTFTPTQFQEQLYLIGNKYLRLRDEYEAIKTLEILYKQDPHYKDVSEIVEDNLNILKYPELANLYCSKKITYIPFIKTRLNISEESNYEDDDLKTIFYHRNNTITIVFHSLTKIQNLYVNDIQAALDKKLMGVTPIEVKLYHYHKSPMDAKDMKLSPKTKLFFGDDFIKVFTGTS